MKHCNKALALFCAAFSSFAPAQQPPALPEVIVTARRFPEPPAHQPVNVTVISEEEIRRNPAATVGDLLAQQPGVTMRSLDGTPNISVDLGGFGASGPQNTLVLVDGQRMNDIDLGGIQWTAIPLSQIQRIEIIRGSGAVLFGEGASGGAVNIITRIPDGKPGGQLSAAAGNYGTQDAQGVASFGDERFSIRAFGQQYRSDNYRRNNRNDETNASLAARLATEIGEWRLSLASERQQLRLPGVRRVNPTLGINELATDPQGTSTPNDYSTRDNDRIALSYTGNLGETELGVDLVHRERKQRAFFGDYVFGGLFDSYMETGLAVNSISPRMRLPHRLLGRDHSLVVGFDAADWDYDSRRGASPASLATPAASIVATQRHRAAYFHNLTRLTESTRLALGARRQEVDFSARDRANPAAYAGGDQRREVNAYEIGLRHQATPATAVFATLGRSFRIATVDEVFSQFGGPLFDSIITFLEPQTSLDRRVGVEHQAGPLGFKASLYHMDLNNEIHFNALTFANTNLSPTRRYGLELESRGAAGKWDLSANYTFAVAEFREGVYAGINVAGNEVPLVPRHKANLTAAYALAAKTRVAGILHYVGEQRFDNDQANTFNQKMPAYRTVDVKLTHHTGNWNLAAAVNNLFNEHYFTYAIRGAAQGVYNAYPMRDRCFSLSARYDFR